MYQVAIARVFVTGFGVFAFFAIWVSAFVSSFVVLLMESSVLGERDFFGGVRSRILVDGVMCSNREC